MEIPEGFVNGVEKANSFPLVLFKYNDIFNEKNSRKILENEDLQTVLIFLKYKFIQIRKHSGTRYSFDVKKLYRRIPKNDYCLLHDILFYSLITQPSLDSAVDFVNESCKFLHNDLSGKDANIILHHLEIIDVILELFVLLNKCLDKDILHEIIINFITNDDNNIRRKITMEIIPKYVEITKKYSLFHTIWQKVIFSTLEICTLLALEKYYIPMIYDENTFNILKLENYWRTLQKNICSLDPLLKKQSQYLLKKSIQALFHNENYQNYVSEIDIIKWDSNNLEAYKNAWKNFIILCEISSEKQIHLIEPTFKLYTSFHPLHYSWKNCITKLFINHPHSAVVKFTITKILRKEWASNIETVVHGLKNIFLYENSADSEFMTHLTQYISTLCQKDYSAFLNEIIYSSSPIPFYHICKTLSSCELKQVDLKTVINFINLAKNLPHLHIRKGIMHSLFLYFVRIVSNSENINTNDFVQMIHLLYTNNYLQRNNYSWKKLLNLLSVNKTIYENFNATEFNFLPEKCAVFVVLLIDGKILDKNWITDYLTNILQETDICKLDYYTFIFSVIRAMSRTDEIFEEDILSYNDLNSIFDDLSVICNQNTYYTVEFFDTVENILDTIIHKIFLNEESCLLFTKFLEKFKNNVLCYVIFSKKLIQLYELNISTTNKQELENLSVNLKNMKQNCNMELKNHENILKHKFFQKYYYTKLNIEKLLIKIDSNNIPDDILAKINEYYDKGSLEIILSVTDSIYTLINNCDFQQMQSNFVPAFFSLLLRCEKDIFILRANELFRPAISKFISIVLHPQIFQHEILKDYANTFCLNMFDSSQLITGIRNEILSRIPLKNLSHCILVEGLLFGQILRKDQRIEFETCSLISEDIKELNSDSTDSYELDRRVRSKSVAILLSMINKSHHNQFCEDIFSLLLDKYNKSAGKRYFDNSNLHLVKLRILQSLHLIVLKLNENSLHFLYEWLFGCLVNESQQPSIKILIQWLMIRICNILNNEEVVIHKLMSEIPDLKGTSCTSLFPLIYHLIKNENSNINVVFECMEFLLPYTMGQQFSIRYSAQITIQHIYKIYCNLPEFCSKYDLILKTIALVLEQTTTEKLNDNTLTYQNLSPTIETIYYNIPRLTNVSPVECLPVDYFSGILNMKLRSNDELCNMQNSTKKLFASSTENHNNMNVQKKIDTYEINLEAKTGQPKNNLGNLIVVASLIDKAPNLGGLNRTCEVFGVRQYILNNIQFMKNKEYQSLSMSSENWTDTVEIKTENLVNYLLEMKKKNYKIIGAEQTADSKMLNSYKFDKYTILLLGNEKEGVSPNLIHLLDDCIEIPQFGQIRSLNVHVAGALFIWEYVKQHQLIVDW